MPRKSSGKRQRNQDHPRRACQKRSDHEVDDLAVSHDAEAEEQQPVPRSEADDLPSSTADTSANTVASVHQHEQQLFGSEEAKEQPQPSFVPDVLDAEGLAGAQAAATVQAGQVATSPPVFPGQAMIIPPGYGIVPLLYPTLAWHPYGVALPPISYIGIPQGMTTPSQIIQQQLQPQPEPAVIPQQQQQPILISQQQLWMPPFQHAEYMQQQQQQQQENILQRQNQMQIVQQQQQDRNHAFQMEAGGDEILAPAQRLQEDEAPNEPAVETKGTAFQGSSPATLAPDTSTSPADRKEGRRISPKKSTSTSAAPSTADAYHDFASDTSMTPATKQAATSRSQATKKSSTPSSSVANKTRSHSSSSATTTTTVTTPALKKISKPKRPLNAYNFFFRDERSRMDDSKIAFEELGRRVSQQWKKVSPKTRAKYQAIADQDRVRYEKEKVLYFQYQRDLLQQYRQEDDQAAAAGAAAGLISAASASDQVARHEQTDATKPKDKTGEIAAAGIEAKGDDSYEADSGDPKETAR